MTQSRRGKSISKLIPSASVIRGSVMAASPPESGRFPPPHPSTPHLAGGTRGRQLGEPKKLGTIVRPVKPWSEKPVRERYKFK